MARFVVTVPIDANSVDQDVFIAPFPCFVHRFPPMNSDAGQGNPVFAPSG